MDTQSRKSERARTHTRRLVDETSKAHEVSLLNRETKKRRIKTSDQSVEMQNDKTDESMSEDENVEENISMHQVRQHISDNDKELFIKELLTLGLDATKTNIIKDYLLHPTYSMSHSRSLTNDFMKIIGKENIGKEKYINIRSHCKLNFDETEINLFLLWSTIKDGHFINSKYSSMDHFIQQ